MMPSRSSALLVAILALAFALVATSCGGGGQSLSLRQYLERLDSLQDEHQGRFDSLVEDSLAEEQQASTDEESIAATRTFWGGFVSFVSDFVDGLKGLDPVQEAERPHNDLLAAESDGLGLARDLVDQLADVGSTSEADDRVNEFNEKTVDIAEREDAALCALQKLAADNDVDVDLDCTDPTGGE